MYDHIISVADYWPSIGPLNVWDLPYDMWLRYLDQYEFDRKLREGS